MQFYTQLSKSIEPFTPQSNNSVSLYTCGPTVYSTPTVGNWASYIYWDILVRTLTGAGFTVQRVMNITDVGHLVSDEDEGEDKLEKGARREGKTAWEVAQFYTEDFIHGMAQLNLIPPTYMPRATEYIPQQLALVRTLKEKGYTYQTSDGIYFDTSLFPHYADFAGLDLAAQKAGARVTHNEEKRNPSDFALWKFTPKGQVRDMQWETPADVTDDNTTPQGFPGWHLECSAMAIELLGQTLDIHTGGIDHIPVHHTNEIAQSEAATGKPFAHYWLHSNHLKVEGTKISKSLGNGYTLQDIQEKGLHPLDLKMAILQGHYRSEGNFTLEGLKAARNRRYHWLSVAALRHQIIDGPQDGAVESDLGKLLTAAQESIFEALADDLNTPEALARIDALFSQLTAVPPSTIPRAAFIAILESIDALLGLALLDTTPDITDIQKQRITEREQARSNKEFAVSDTLRDELLTDGIIVRDTPDGTLWEYKEV